MENKIFSRKLALQTDFSAINLIDSAEKRASYLIVTEKGRHLKISPTSYFLLKNFDAGLSAQEIADSFNRSQNSEISAEKVAGTIENLVETIEKLDENNDSRRSGFLFLREIIPRRAVARAARHLSPMFHPFAAGLSIVLILFGIFFNVRENVFSGSLSAIESPFDFWLGYFLFLLSVLAHEFGHAAACIRYGAAPSGIGFTVYLIFPALYSDVTNSWKLKSAQRVVVGFGGMYFQLLVAVYYTILDNIAPAGCFKVAVPLIFVACILNLNPFLKFDGYWIFSDLLGVVNLSRQPKRFVLFVYNRLRGIETENLPWSNRISALVGIYSIGSALMLVLFASIYLPHLFVELQKYPAQMRHFFAEISNGQSMSFSEMHKFFLANLTVFVFFYFVYNAAVRPLVKKFSF